MSKKHRNYTDYTKPQQEAPVVGVDLANGADFSAPVVEPVIEEPVTEEPEVVYGVVSECALLNMRVAPNIEADIVAKLPIATEVMVDKTSSTDDFYKVCTGSGIEGYCMKRFITLD